MSKKDDKREENPKEPVWKTLGKGILSLAKGTALVAKIILRGGARLGALAYRDAKDLYNRQKAYNKIEAENGKGGEVTYSNPLLKRIFGSVKKEEELKASAVSEAAVPKKDVVLEALQARAARAEAAAQRLKEADRHLTPDQLATKAVSRELSKSKYKVPDTNPAVEIAKVEVKMRAVQRQQEQKRGNVKKVMAQIKPGGEAAANDGKEKHSLAFYEGGRKIEEAHKSMLATLKPEEAKPQPYPTPPVGGGKSKKSGKGRGGY